MEDLVAFGKDPYTEHISVYRASDGKFGFAIGKIRNPVTNKEAGGCYIDDVVESSQADQDGRLQEGDLILEVNGKDARQWMLEQVLEELQTTPSLKPLRLKVKHREQSNAVPAAAVDRIQKDESHDNLSDHAICPYYISRAIQPHAEITFAPYNYILDPGIRKAMNIGLKNTVIVLDEAHNIESTLCEGGSFKYGEIDLSQIVSVLGPFARRNPNTGNITLIDTGVQEDTSFVAHELLCFVETIISHLSTLRESFENDSPHIRELEEKYERFGNVPDDHEVEVCFHGPTGHGFQGETVGCKPFFDRPGLEKFNLPYFERLLHYAVSFESEIFGGEQNSSIESQRRSYTFSKIIDLLAKLQKAAENPEHYYICCTVQANGNLDHAFCKNSGGRSPGWKKNPQSYPFMPPHDGRSPLADVRRCNQEDCESLHGEYCNGTTPRWECHLVLKLLSPGLLLKDISKQCRSLILASGSLSPIPSLCAELNLFGPEEATTPQTTPSKSTFSPLKSQPGRKHEHLGRLQTKPAPLEANHVIDLSKQLLAVAIGIFPDGTQLTVNFNNYQHDDFYAKLGDAIASVIEGVPSGGVLVFVPSYTFLKRCITSWDSKNGHERDNGTVSTEIWERILTSKGKIIVEPNKGQDEFEAARDEYRDTISKTGSCVLLAVFRGKMSEGISFNDNNARAVICVGLPFPAAKERSVVTKKNYNDEQRRFRKNTSLLPGNEWYSQQAYRAIAQALGRCIRHGADYGTIILMDSRHCNDGSPNLDNQDGVCRAHRNLPKWMRGCVRTLSPNKTKGTKSDDILGGYAGLRSCMHAFFEQAPAVSDAVKKKWKEDLQKAQERSQSTAGRVFNNITGRWDASSAVKPEKL
jgi:Fanconi anemia group J protein